MSAYNIVSEYLTKKFPTKSWVKMQLTGTTLTDSITNRSITTTNCTSYVGPEGVENTAIALNGTNAFVNTGITFPTGDYTIRLKFRANTGVTTDSYIFSIGRTTGTNAPYENNGIGLLINSAGKIVIYNWLNSSSGTVVLTSQNVYERGVWYEFTLTKLGTTYTVYINNKKIGSFVSSVNPLTSSVLYLGKLNVTGYEFFFNGQITDLQIYQAVLTPEDIMVKPSVILNNGEYKTYTEGVWATVSTSIPTITEFVNQGMMDLSVLTRLGDTAPLDLLSGTAQLLTWTQAAQPILTVNKKMPSQTIYQLNDTNISSVEKIARFTTDASGVKIGISVGGNTWHAYTGGVWNAITDIKDGMTKTDLESLDDTIMRTLLGDSQSMRFALCFEDENSYISTLTMTTDLEGVYSVTPTTDYTYTYNMQTATITYTVKKDGVYSVNYVIPTP